MYRNHSVDIELCRCIPCQGSLQAMLDVVADWCLETGAMFHVTDVKTVAMILGNQLDMQPVLSFKCGAEHQLTSVSSHK